MDGMWFTPLLDQVWPAKYGCDSFSLSKLEINFFNSVQIISMLNEFYLMADSY
jgi:hypothetical protein